MATATTVRHERSRPARVDEHGGVGGANRAARWLSAAVVVLLVGSSLAGLLVNGLYRDTDAAVLLWRRRPWGHVLGGVMLVAGALTQLTYIAALVFQSRADIAGASGFDTSAPVVLGVYLAGAGLLLGNVRRDRNPTAGVAPLT